MRTFEQTHQWLKFEPDLRRLSYKLWMLLGEAKSKCDHIAGIPLQPATAAYLHRLYLAKGVLASTAIEGNTLSEEEVMRLLDKTLKLPPSKAYLEQEVANIIAACGEIAKRIFQQNQRSLSVELIKDLNRMVLKDLSLAEGVAAGELRQFKVGVGRYGAVDAADCKYLLGEFCRFLNGSLGGLEADRMVIGIVKAVLGHLYFELIHPFGDGNGRTGRLIEFFILLCSGVPTAAAHLLSNFYNQTRAEYYRQLDYISQSKGDVVRFLEYALSGLVDGLQEQINVIRFEQITTIWCNFVHESFRDASTADKRRRDLALAISTPPRPPGNFIPIEKVLETQARAAAAYAKKTKKTLRRDLGALEKKGIVEISPQGVRARIEILSAFQPERVAEESK